MRVTRAMLREIYGCFYRLPFQRKHRAWDRCIKGGLIVYIKNGPPQVTAKGQLAYERYLKIYKQPCYPLE